jgi:hypothetical protein
VGGIGGAAADPQDEEAADAFLGFRQDGGRTLDLVDI